MAAETQSGWFTLATALVSVAVGGGIAYFTQRQSLRAGETDRWQQLTVSALAQTRLFLVDRHPLTVADKIAKGDEAEVERRTGETEAEWTVIRTPLAEIVIGHPQKEIREGVDQLVTEIRGVINGGWILSSDRTRDVFYQNREDAALAAYETALDKIDEMASLLRRSPRWTPWVRRP